MTVSLKYELQLVVVTRIKNKPNMATVGCSERWLFDFCTMNNLCLDGTTRLALEGFKLDGFYWQ